MSRGIVLFGAADCGMYPLAGPHVIQTSQGGRELYLQRHLQKLRTDIAVNIPDPAYDGLAAIDCGAWMPYWSGHDNTPSDQGPLALDRDFIDDWRDFIRDSHPELLAGKKPEKQEEVFVESWLETTREFWTRTLDECKLLRPHAKWGLCNLPVTPYFAWLASEDPVQQQKLQLMKRAHDVELAWLFDRVDVHFPGLTIPFEGVSARPNWNLRQVNQGDIEQYLRLNSVEAIRVSRGKPVIALIRPLYADAEQSLRGRWLNDLDLHASFQIPKSCGAAGVAICGQIGDFNHPQEEWQRTVDARLLPMALMFAHAPPLPLKPGPSKSVPAATALPTANPVPTPVVTAAPDAESEDGTEGPRFSAPSFAPTELNGAIQRMRYSVFKGKNGKKGPLRREPPHQSATVPEPASPSEPK